MNTTDPPEAGASGLTIVVNPSAGPALSGSPADHLREAFPQAQVVELEDPADIPDRLREAATNGATALGVAGGDGSVNAAAEIAVAHNLPLMIVPAGTLNHLARDLRLTSVQDAIGAFRTNSIQAIDVATIDGKPFLNTASIGSYVQLVDRRERLERRIGKWPAFVLAFFSLLFRSEPVHIRIDGKERRVWVAFFGNCAYTPTGVAPRARTRLDDGLIDVRILDSRHGWARLRLMAAGIVGRSHRARGFEQGTASQIDVAAMDPSIRLSRDGETFDGSTKFEVAKIPKVLRVFAPGSPD
ncbi:MAG TPA: diacylglycerol kinase family protein [Acidimicrobiales bacterium]|nr:diacylglycerol kinase family protein [Acidimicrobiales bacterium]